MLIIFFILFFVAIANANTFIYLTFPSFSLMLIVILPIILFETLFIKLKLLLTWKKAFNVSIIVNVISTIIGIPLNYFLKPYVIHIYHNLTSIPIQSINNAITFGINTSKYGVTILSNYLLLIVSILFIINFLLSWIVESYIAIRLMKNKSTLLVLRVILFANFSTYFVAFVMLVLINSN